MLRLKILVFVSLFCGTAFSQCTDVEIVFESPWACAGGPEDILWSLYNGETPLLEDIYHYFPLNPDPMIEEFCLPAGDYTITACGEPFMIESNFSGEIRINGNTCPILDGPYWIDGCFSCTVAVEAPCLGDFDADGNVAVSDMLMMLSDFGCNSECSTDINNDGSVGLADLLGILTVFGTICP